MQLAVANGRWRDSPSLRRASASTLDFPHSCGGDVVDDDSAGEERHWGEGGRRRVHRAERTAGCVVRHCRPAQRISLHLKNDSLATSQVEDINSVKIPSLCLLEPLGEIKLYVLKFSPKLEVKIS